jgi:hypothetical protein
MGTATARWTKIAVASAAMAIGACRTAAPVGANEIADEANVHDFGLVCDRVHDMLRERDEGRISLELPAIAVMVERAVHTSGPVSDCGGEMVAWIRAVLDQRPIDLRPRLEARIAALGVLLSADNHWRRPIMETLAGLLLDAGTPTAHMVEQRTFLGPGSQSVRTGWSEVVSMDDMDRWVALALRRGYAEKVFVLGKNASLLEDDYADLLARLFAARYAAPASAGSAHRVVPAGRIVWPLPLGKSSRSAPPEPEHLGCGRAPLDLLWPDLVSAFRAAPLSSRWAAVPAPLVERARVASPCE